MCTLILGVDVVRPRSVILAANRDEDPSRPTDPPGILHDHPRVVGGRDARSGGTWLALRSPDAAVALLNRRPDGSAPASPRSRGLLTLDVAAAEPDGSMIGAARRTLISETSRQPYAPFSMVFASAEESWVVSGVRGKFDLRTISSGWNVITHEGLNDPEEPRTAWLWNDLVDWRPASLDETVAGLKARLAIHAAERPGAPDVCIHEGRMPTVSASLVWIAQDERRYFHAEGRPCVTPWKDFSDLFDPLTGEFSR